MMTMNRATLLGFAGKHPELRKLPSGDDVAQFSLATSERFRRKDDSVGEATQWHTIVAYGAAAEVVRTRVRKGDPVLVEGRIATRSWEDKAGNERRAIEIVVAGRGGTVNVLTKRRPGGNGDGDPPGGAAPAAAAPPGNGGDDPSGKAVSGGAVPVGGSAGTEAAGAAAVDVLGKTSGTAGEPSGAAETQSDTGGAAAEPGGNGAGPASEAGESTAHAGQPADTSGAAEAKAAAAPDDPAGHD